jgi:hypothetical protein
MRAMVSSRAGWRHTRRDGVGSVRGRASSRRVFRRSKTMNPPAPRSQSVTPSAANRRLGTKKGHQKRGDA